MPGNSWQQPVASEPSGGTWHKITDPPTGTFASKTAGWTADNFSGGLFEVDFSSLVPSGTRAVRASMFMQTTSANAYYRKSGDTNISNTPNASSEWSHRISNREGVFIAVLWLSADYKVQFAVADVSQDLYVLHPIEYMI